jgi:hypothetical protein
MNREFTAPAYSRSWSGRLIDDKAVNRPGTLGKPDRDEAKTQLARDPEAHAEEQPPDVRYRDPARRARRPRRPVSQHQKGTKHFQSPVAHIRLLHSGQRGEAPWRSQASASAAKAGRFVVAGPIRRIGEHAPCLAENLACARGGRDNRRRRARDQFRPQQPHLGVVLVLDLLGGGARQHPEKVVPGNDWFLAKLTHEPAPFMRPELEKWSHIRQERALRENGDRPRARRG